MKNRGKLATIICAAFIGSASWGVNVYAETINNDGMTFYNTNQLEEINEIENFLNQYVGEKIKLGSDDIDEKKRSSEMAAARITYTREEENAQLIAKGRPPMRSDKTMDTVSKTGREKTLPTLDEYNMNEAKKIFRYSEDLIEKMKNGDPLEGEHYSWMIPIINTAGEEGFLWIGESETSGELLAESVEFRINNEKPFMSNEEMLSLINAYKEDEVSVEAIYFVDLPISSSGRIAAAVVLSSEEVIFVTIENANYYRKLEFNEVYSYKEILDSLRK